MLLGDYVKDLSHMFKIKSEQYKIIRIFIYWMVCHFCPMTPFSLNDPRSAIYNKIQYLDSLELKK